MVVQLVEAGVVEPGVIRRGREATVEKGEVGLGIGVIGDPLGSEEDGLRLTHLLLEDAGLHDFHLYSYTNVLELTGYEIYYIGKVVGREDLDGAEASALGKAGLSEK